MPPSNEWGAEMAWITSDPLDVWLYFDADDDDESTLEANTYRTDVGFEIQWYHVDIGVVNRVQFDTLSDVYDWYASEGFEDYSS